MGRADIERARKQLVTLAAYLDRIAPDAASSLREGMEETLTVTRLRIDPALAIHLVTTNPIESAFSCVRRLTGRVKRWRSGMMKHRWCATGLLDAEKRFRRIKGFSSMPLWSQRRRSHNGSGEPLREFQLRAGQRPPQWLIYITVSDLDASIKACV